MKRYSVTKIAGEMVVTPDKEGKYRASTSEEIKRALSEPRHQTTTAEVLIGNTWYPLRRSKLFHKRTSKKAERPYSTPSPIKPLPLLLRILRKLHLYKDPLDILIYHGEKNN